MVVCLCLDGFRIVNFSFCVCVLLAKLMIVYNTCSFRVCVCMCGLYIGTSIQLGTSMGDPLPDRKKCLASLPSPTATSGEQWYIRQD